MAAMTSRQRVITALDHREPDRVPFDCTFGNIAYARLEKYLGYKSQVEVHPSGPSLNVRPPVEFLQLLQIDLYYIGLGLPKSVPSFEFGMETYTDEWGVLHRKIENPLGCHYESVSHPLASARIEDLDDFPWPDPNDPALVNGLEEKAHNLYANTDLALVGKFSNSLFEQAFILRGLEQLFLDFSLNPEFVCALMDKLTEIAIQLVRVGLSACGKYLQILRLAGDDMGHQRGTLLSPTKFRQIVKPRFARLYQEAKRLFQQYNPKGKLMAHSDGDVYPLLPDYIEMGLDIFNPVQPYVAEMEHTRLKREYGNRLCFHGGMDIQNILPYGDPDIVRAEAIKVMQALGRGGGFILAPTHYLLADVPPENVIALRDAVLEHGSYPLAN
jgi:uroporphyrinogen decarboxylase